MRHTDRGLCHRRGMRHTDRGFLIPDSKFGSDRGMRRTERGCLIPDRSLHPVVD
jgi:hypothetical protein